MYVMILDGHYPQDIRVRKEALSLAESGRPVTVVTRWKKGQLREEVLSGVRVLRIGKDYTFRRKGITDIRMAIFFRDRTFSRFLKNFLAAEEVRVLHVHDLPLVRTVHERRDPSKTALILDMHENYPEMLEEYTLSSKGMLKDLKDRLFFSVRRWKNYESRVIRYADHIIAVVEEMKEKFIREYRLRADHISIISNYEHRSFSTVDEEDDFEFREDTFYITYVGGISPVRGLQTVIEALPLLREQGRKVVFLVIGSTAASHVERLRILAAEKQVSDLVLFLGYRDIRKVNFYMKHAGVNIIPHLKSPHTDHTIPHKLFQIMLLKSPLMVSSCDPLKRIAGEEGAGFVYEAGNATDLAQQVAFVADHPGERQKRIEKAYELVRTRYNWESEAKKLIELYDRFHGQKITAAQTLRR